MATKENSSVKKTLPIDIHKNGQNTTFAILWKGKHTVVWTFVYLRLLNKPYENEVALTGKKYL